MTRSKSATTRRLPAVVAIALLLGSSALLSACNTTAGAGKDISAAGQAVSKGADSVKSNIPAP